MSRCFPFPPPGYEKKFSTDESDSSLLKEKQKKEKKHKKDKEKKKDKETSKDKHKERKEKKEKHKDKKKDKDRDKEKSRTTSENRKAAVVGVVQNTTGDKEKVVTNTVLNNGRNGESKFVQDLARRIRDDEKATDSQSVGKNSLPNGVRENNNPVLQNNHRKVDEKRSYTMEKKSENGFLPVSSRTDQKGSEIMVKPSEKKDQGKKTELLQEKNHRKEGVTKSDKPLDREGVKKNEPKYTANKKSEEEKTEAINKSGHDQPKHGEGGPRLKDIDVADTRNFRAHDDLSKASSKSVTVLGKRKDLETNGFLYENGSRPNKIQRPAASPLTSVKNGIKLEACQTLPKPVSELQGPPVCKPEVKEDIIKAKEHRVNGFVDSQEPKKRPTYSSSVKVKENGEASSKKRPHPDLKYLDQILNVPQREELHEVDGNEEQEWLFGQSVKLLKKPKTDSTASLDESLQVWNQTLRLESADTVALPYVVPF